MLWGQKLLVDIHEQRNWLWSLGTSPNVCPVVRRGPKPWEGKAFHTHAEGMALQVGLMSPTAGAWLERVCVQGTGGYANGSAIHSSLLIIAIEIVEGAKCEKQSWLSCINNYKMLVGAIQT